MGGFNKGGAPFNGRDNSNMGQNSRHHQNKMMFNKNENGSGMYPGQFNQGGGMNQ